MEKLIVTVAPTGSITVPAQTPYLPVTPDEIADEAVRAWEAGAAVAHIHARDPETGHPSADQELFGQILKKIKERCDIVICTTTGGGIGMTLEQRVAVVSNYRPEMASFNMGSMNFALYPVVRRMKEFKHGWERPYLEGSKDFVFKNTFTDLEYISQKMAEYGTKPELECYDVGHLYNAAQIVNDGFLKLPIHMQFVMGVLGGIMPSLENLMHMKRTADQLFGSNYTWSVIGVGYPDEFYMGTLAIMMGGHVRVGLEDNIRVARGQLAEGNAPLVEKIVRIARELGREIATPDEARRMLGLKGKDKVGF